MKNQATLKRIADHLNLSISTVSRALKDHPDVSAETIRRVKELALLLDYEPNAFAVNLRKKHSNIYAILVPQLSGFFYNSFIEAVEEEARQRGFSIMLLQSNEDPEVEKQNLKLCRYNHVAGVFVAITRYTTDFSAFERIQEMDIPVVFFDKVPPVEGLVKVCLADKAAGALAAEKLLLTGKQKVWAVLGNASLSITRLREDGLRQVMATQPHISLDVSYANSEDEAFEMVYHFPFESDGQKVALFCMSDELLCGSMRALYARNIEVPGQVSVIAISNGYLPRLFYPTISYVETSGFKLGKLSFEKMEQIKKGVAEPNTQEFLKCNFYEGKSL